ncbi:cyanate permease [Evansella vedderi]|uniref:Cyanate permease n=1 Tax=Evansella vedderi TaxID=38282 RepID=A0ABT9ZTZ0_9BACI|nr:hypothetical protein [Evansella vedderi]MDQ0254674.1 cyanate permease [Evansella vedderi]
MAQSFGYFLEAIGPISVGLFFDIFNSWAQPLLLFILVTFALIFF